MMDVFRKTIASRLMAIVIVLILAIGGIGYVAWYKLFRVEPIYYESAEEHFKYGSIGTEDQEGVPYWIWVELPRLFPEYLPAPGGYTSLGITWEEGKELPVGFSKKIIGFPRQGITCAVCHHTVYRTAAIDKPIIVPTGPANTFNLQGYIRFLGNCASDPRFTADYLLNKINYDVQLSWLDKLLYRFLIIPQTRKGLLNLRQSFAWMDSRPDWGPGRIDPFNPVKFRVLKQPLDDTIGNSDMMPLWNEKMHDGFAYHWDGLETSLTETVRTGAIGDGTSKKSLNVKDLARVEQFIRDYPPPHYPYPVNPELATRGSQIFASSCAACHAFGGERTGTVIPVDEVGTDRHRLDMWTKAAADAYNQFAEGYDWDFNQLRKTNGYLSVSLEGLWLRAPYLHNGSVPSLTDLLQPPEQRTPIFYRGYDVYDPEKVGFVSEGAEAEKAGWKYDTGVPANGNQGHLYGTELPTDDKKALLEYLKTL